MSSIIKAIVGAFAKAAYAIKFFTSELIVSYERWRYGEWLFTYEAMRPVLIGVVEQEDDNHEKHFTELWAVNYGYERKYKRSKRWLKVGAAVSDTISEEGRQELAFSLAYESEESHL